MIINVSDRIRLRGVLKGWTVEQKVLRAASDRSNRPTWEVCSEYGDLGAALEGVQQQGCELTYELMFRALLFELERLVHHGRGGGSGGGAVATAPRSPVSPSNSGSSASGRCDRRAARRGDDGSGSHGQLELDPNW